MISYRRDDTGAITGRIFDRLEARYGRDAIFRDIDNIPMGVDFRKRLNDVIERTDVLLVVMGSKWLGPRKNRRFKITDESDPVRVEIEIALSRSVPIIPLLIDKAKMPRTTDLPSSLADLSFRNAAKLDSMYDFDHDVDRLIRHVDNISPREGLRQMKFRCYHRPMAPNQLFLRRPHRAVLPLTLIPLLKATPNNQASLSLRS